MRKYGRVAALGVGLALVVGLAALPTGAQEPKAKGKGAPPPKADEKRVGAPPGVRVPNYFNRLDPPLTPEQRERIYAIQEKALHDSEAVLTAPQRQSLADLRAGTAEPDDEPPAAKKAFTKKGAPPPPPREEEYSKKATPKKGDLPPDDEPPAKKGTPPRKKAG